MSTNGPPQNPPATPAARPPANPPDPEEQRRIAERRVMEEMARQKRAEERQLAGFKYGCFGLLGLIVLLLIIGFML